MALVRHTQSQRFKRGQTSKVLLEECGIEEKLCFGGYYISEAPANVPSAVYLNHLPAQAEALALSTQDSEGLW